MNLSLFFAAELKSGLKSFELDDDTARHAVQVLRMKAGDKLLLTNGKGLKAEAEVLSAGKKSCLVKIVSEENFSDERLSTCIAISPLKNAARFEWFLEKAAELGIKKIVPLISKRTERQHYKEERWKTILVSAMQQSQQYWLTELSTPVSFDAFIRDATSSHKFIAHCLPTEKSELQTIHWNDEALILIGPEGDFTPDEVKHAVEAGYSEVSLGNTRLRTETAAITAAVILIHKN